jgi:tetratricopeptide (TPR) repeat protein
MRTEERPRRGRALPTAVLLIATAGLTPVCAPQVAQPRTAPASPAAATMSRPAQPPGTVAITVTTSPAAPAGAPAPHAGPSTIAGWADGAMLFGDLGVWHRPVTTFSAEAQAYFDQGLRLAYGFNHDEAARSFARAATIDPGCAMCFWGLALTLGPNYNTPMLPGRAQVAWQALERARAAAPRTTPVEQALIAALAVRYAGPEPRPPAQQQAGNVAYAAAMRQVASLYPNDDDVQVLYAESLMDTNPWKLWGPDGTAAPHTEEIVATLETVLLRDPAHPGANHYYIHAVEASPNPGRALAVAERLPSLMPGAGHLVHMPAHIYQRVGNYAWASESNRRAIAADERYLARTRPLGYYPMYVGHNWGFLSYSAAMEGRSAESLAAAREAARALPPEMLTAMPGMDFFAAEPLLAMVRFGRWEELRREPRPPAAYMVQTALWLHARGMADASTDHLDEATQDLAELRTLQASLPADLQAGNNSARDIANVGTLALQARIAEVNGDSNAAVAYWREAVAAQDRLIYAEPADWFYPMRHYLGAALMDAHDYVAAEQVYREDLWRNPGNGWSLYGLRQSLRAQGRTDEAARVWAEFDRAWANADFRLTRTAI